MKTALALGCVVLAVSSVAPSMAYGDDTFEKKAQGAVRVKALDDVVWALTAPCDKGDELQQRQCRLVRDARAKTYTGATLVVDGDTAFTPGAWNGAARSVPQVVTACIRCSGITVDGRAWYLTGSTARQDGAKVAAAPLFDNARQFPNEARAKTWLASVANARTQFVVKIPEKRRWSVAGKDGLLFDVLAWRVIQPCSGEVVLASTKSGPAEPDKTACTTSTATGAQTEVIPALTREMVRDAMKPVLQGAKACYAKYKAAGKARLDIAIAGDGSVKSATQTGDFKGTPTGICIDAAVTNLVFPPSQRPVTTVGFPIIIP